jgi:AhpD family alkylhydroperoxidase
MDTRTKELIAIGAAVTANCVPCLRFHLDRARKEGAEEAEIRAAISVGRMVRKGAAGNWDEEATALLETEGAAVPTDKSGEAEKISGHS